MNLPVEKENMTFSEYFSVNDGIDAIVESFGYTHRIETLTLPVYSDGVEWAESLHRRFESHIRNITMVSEVSKREFLIAPLLSELVGRYGIRIRSEYTLKVSALLQGNLDYLVFSTDSNSMVVVEAKQGDLQRGMQQLAVEMIAVDQWSNSPTHALWGVITTGDSWRFVHLDRAKRCLTQDFNLFDLPADTEPLVRVLLAILVSPALAS